MIQYVHKHTSQQICTCAEDMARDAVWAISLARVNMFKCFTHVSHGEGEPTGFGSGPCQWHCIVLKASKKLFHLSGRKTSMSVTGLVFFF